MAKVVLAPHIKSLHGRIGNVIHYNVYGYQYARSYTIPRNPRTEAQQANRTAFAQAVEQWHLASPSEQSYYDRMARGNCYSGYNLFISMHMKGITTRMLKQIYSIQAGTRLLPGKYLQAVNSVINTISSRYGGKNPVLSPVYSTGPPGKHASAA